MLTQTRTFESFASISHVFDGTTTNRLWFLEGEVVGDDAGAIIETVIVTKGMLTLCPMGAGWAETREGSLVTDTTIVTFLITAA